jgi:integrase
MAIEKRASKRSRSGFTYRVRYPDPRREGRWASETFDDYNDAESFDALWKVERRRGRLAMLDAGTELVGDYTLEWFEAWMRSPGKGSATKAKKTIREKERVIDSYILAFERNGAGARWGRDSIAWLQLRQVDARVIERWLFALQDEGVGSESIRKAMTALSQVFDRALAHRRYPHAINPVDAVPKPPPGERRQPLVFTPDKVEEMRAKFLARGDRLSAYLVSTLAYSGARPGEVLGAQRRHLLAADLEADPPLPARLRVEQRNSLGELLNGAKSTKRPRRSIPLPAALVNDLETWVDSRKLKPNDQLFPSRRDGGLWNEHDYRNWRARDYAPMAKSVGLTTEQDNPYDLRHVYISLRYAAGHNPIEIAKAAGHAPTLSMDYYADVIEAYEGKGPIDWEAEIASARGKHAQ